MRQGAVVVIAILLAKSSIGQEEIGVYEMLQYLSFLVTSFWVSGIIQAILTTYPKLSEAEKPILIGNTYLLFTLISVVLFVLLFACDNGVQRIFFNQTGLPYYHIFVAFLLLNTPVFLLENFYLLQNRGLSILILGVFSFGLQLLAVLLPVFLGYPFIWSFYSLLALAVLKHLWLLVFVLKNGRFAVHKKLIIQILGLSAPLMMYSLLSAVNLKFDSWFITYIYPGDEELFAIFAYGARELPIVMTMAAAFSSALLPEVAKDTVGSLKMIREKSVKLFHFLFPFSILLMLTSKYWFPLLFNQGFLESVPVFNVFLLVVISRLIFSRTILVGLQDNKMVLLISIAELLLNIILSIILVKYFGLLGIAIGTVLAYWMEKALISFYLFKKYKIGLGAYVNLNWYLAYSVGLLLCFFFFGINQ